MQRLLVAMPVAALRLKMQNEDPLHLWSEQRLDELAAHLKRTGVRDSTRRTEYVNWIKDAKTLSQLDWMQEPGAMQEAIAKGLRPDRLLAATTPDKVYKVLDKVRRNIRNAFFFLTPTGRANADTFLLSVKQRFRSVEVNVWLLSNVVRNLIIKSLDIKLKSYVKCLTEALEQADVQSITKARFAAIEEDAKTMRKALSSPEFAAKTESEFQDVGKVTLLVKEVITSIEKNRRPS